MLKRMHILAGGRVQGVGFRGTCMQYALLYHLTGNVMNLENSDVEINVQGEEKELTAFIRAIQNEKRWIRVDRLAITEVTPLQDEKQFRIRGYFW